jgi:hypothetical protein
VGVLRVVPQPEVLGVGTLGPQANHKIVEDRWGICRCSHETAVTGENNGTWIVSRPAEFVEDVSHLCRLIDHPWTVAGPTPEVASAHVGNVVRSWHPASCCSGCCAPIPHLIADHTIVPNGPVPLVVLLYVAMIAP